MDPIFPNYSFKHPVTGRHIQLGTASYLLAGLLGPIYAICVTRIDRVPTKITLLTAVCSVRAVVLIAASNRTPSKFSVAR